MGVHVYPGVRECGQLPRGRGTWTRDRGDGANAERKRKRTARTESGERPVGAGGPAGRGRPPIVRGTGKACTTYT